MYFFSTPCWRFFDRVLCLLLFADPLSNKRRQATNPQFVDPYTSSTHFFTSTLRRIVCLLFLSPNAESGRSLGSALGWCGGKRVVEGNDAE